MPSESASEVQIFHMEGRSMIGGMEFCNLGKFQFQNLPACLSPNLYILTHLKHSGSL